MHSSVELTTQQLGAHKIHSGTKCFVCPWDGHDVGMVQINSFNLYRSQPESD